MSSLLSNVSRLALIASVATLSAPIAASAADNTISTPTTAAQTLIAGNNLIVTSTGAISAPANPAVAVTGGVAASSLINSGTIESTATGARGIRFVTSTTANVTITNNAGAVIQSQSDAIQSNVNLSAGTIVINNSGTIRSTGTGSNNGQAIDLANVTAGTASFTINNFATGVITAADADAIRAPNNGVINNYGLIYSVIGTAANGNASGNDAVDFQGNTGTVNNFAGGTISSARHGITGDLGVTVNNGGTIIGNDGAGINIDSTSNASITNVVNRGTIIGTAKTADGDAIDVDRLLNLDNYGTVRAVGIGVGSISEALAIGGGTVNNFAGGLISSDQRAITVDDSNLGNAFAAVTINNAGTIQGANGEAIRITSTFANTLTNSGAIIGSVTMGSGNDTVSIRAGSTITGLVDGAAGTDTLDYNKIGLTAAKQTALAAGQTVNVGGTLYTGFETFSGVTASFGSYATNSTTRNIAAILDNLSNTQAVGGGSQTIIDRVATASDVNGALSQLTPTAFQGLTSAAIMTANQTTQIIDQRLSNVRAGGLGFAMSGVDTVAGLLNGDRSGLSTLAYSPSAQDPALAAFAKAGSGQGFKKAPERIVDADSDSGMFLYGNTIFARQGATANSPESKFTAAGITAGFDRRLTPDFVLGVLAGYTRTNADLDTAGSTSKIDTWLLGTYASYSRQNWFVNGSLVYGHNSYSNNRVAVGTTNTSSPTGHQIAAQGSIGADFNVGRFILTPELGAQYTTVRVNAFSEAGAAALNVDADQSDSLRSNLGVRLRTLWQTGWGTVTPEWRASWQHEFLSKERDLRASFVDQALPGSFTTTAAGSGRDFGNVGAGLTARVAERTDLVVNYDFKFGSDAFTAHQISGRLRRTF